MINTIEELVALTELHAAKCLEEGFPRNAEQVQLRTPGCTPEELAELKSDFPEMPDSYLEVATRVSLFNTTLVGFMVGPYRHGNCQNYLDGMRQGNSSDFWYSEFLRDLPIYWVASFDRDDIFVARNDSKRPGEVHIILDPCMPEPRVRRFAWNFEQVLLAFGRIREAHFHKRFGAASVAEVTASLPRDFSFDKEHMEEWEIIVSQALDEDPAEPIELVEKAPLPTNTSKPERSWLPSFLRRSSPK